MATKDEKIIVDLSQGTFVGTVFKNGVLQLVEIGIDSLGQKVYADKGHWISSVITYPDKFKEYKNMEFTPVIQEGAAYKISVSSSDNMATWSEYVEIDSQNNILNEKSNYVRIKIELFASKAHSEMVVDSFTTNGYNNDQIVVADGKLKLNKNQTLNGAIDSSAVPTVLNTTISKTNLKKINGVGYEGSPQSAIKTLILSSDGEYKKWVESGSTWQTISTTPPTSEQFLEHGMDDLSILNRTIKTTSNQPALEGVLTNGKVYKSTINLNKIIDLKSIGVE